MEHGLNLVVALGAGIVFLVAAVLVVSAFRFLVEPAVRAVKPLMRWVDEVCVRHVATWVGLNRPERRYRWGGMTGLLALSLLGGTYLPPLASIAALFTGLLVVFVLFRRWAWDEDDRAAGLLSHQKRLRGTEDYYAEFLVGLAAFFSIGTLLLGRLTGLHLFVAEPSAGLLSDAIYLAYEAFQSIPIVGNIEVFGFENPAGVTAILPVGGWASFLLRLVLDLVVIAGILKIIEVVRRVSSGQDLRELESRLASEDREVARCAIDALAEKTSRGNAIASQLLRNFSAPAADSHVGRREDRIVAVERLFEIATRTIDGSTDMLLTVAAAASQLSDPDLVRADPAMAANLFRMRGEALFLLGKRAGGAAATAYLSDSVAALERSAQLTAASGTPSPLGNVALSLIEARAERALSANGDRQSALPAIIEDLIRHIADTAHAEGHQITRAILLLGHLTSVDALHNVVDIAALQRSVLMITSLVEAAPDDDPVLPYLFLVQMKLTGAVGHAAESAAAAHIYEVTATQLKTMIDSADDTVPQLVLVDTHYYLAHLCGAWAARFTSATPGHVFDLGEQHADIAKRLLDDVDGIQRLACDAIRANLMQTRCSQIADPGQRRALLDRSIGLFRRVLSDPHIYGHPLSYEASSNFSLALMAKAATFDSLDEQRVWLGEAISEVERTLANLDEGTSQPRMQMTHNLGMMTQAMANIAVDADARRSYLTTAADRFAEASHLMAELNATQKYGSAKIYEGLARGRLDEFAANSEEEVEIVLTARALIAEGLKSTTLEAEPVAFLWGVLWDLRFAINQAFLQRSVSLLEAIIASYDKFLADHQAFVPANPDVASALAEIRAMQAQINALHVELTGRPAPA